MNTATSFIQIKVGEKEHIERLFNLGEVYLNSVQYFKEHENPKIGDVFEGAEIIESGKIIKYRKDLDKEKIFCMWHINSSNPIQEEYIHKIIQNTNDYIDIELDIRSLQTMHGKDSACVIIYDIKEFNNRFQNACKKANVNFIDKKIVHYYNEYSKTKINNITPFMKRSSYSSQQEIRYLIKTKSSEILKLYLGDLSDIAKLIDSNLCKITIREKIK